ncbi:pseudouridine synthase [Halomonas heilongjiangensis]|uniref:Pseudouridine synthase n=1 Tax=Halomonas heilongjiangensis TaxID=1387883 RepID=A0A2N7TNW7_9GAMM|nr:pseudouridine synthase [Halomonas heilongjiangensis]PMR69886.1 pseudouridine synthase [Halomonas heilongjiangensis]PXX88005.1 pseudouridine synthase [Halomonas heilongjiangensis]
MSALYLLHKPYRMLSQFTDRQADDDDGERRATLADVIAVPGIYAAGRLDYDSEGLLLLSDDGELIHRISDPRHKQPKTYRVQVEGRPSDAALQALRDGVRLKDGRTRPAKVRRLATSGLPERDPPLDPKRHPVTTWLELTISEGRNRQVRRMTAHVGHPTLRLVRVAIGPWRLDDLAPGQWRRETLHAPRPAASPSHRQRPTRYKGGRR